MATKPTYWELLKHPNWQRKRLEVMKLAGFMCSVCEAADKTLNVHHSYYEKGKAPWEYPTESLHCLCEDCHVVEQDKMDLLRRQIGKLDLNQAQELYGYALGLEMSQFPMVASVVYSYEVAKGVAYAWGLLPEDVINSLVDRSIDGYRLDELVKQRKAR